MGDIMGAGQSNQENDTDLESRLMNLPPEVRQPILKYLGPVSRQMCRLTCSTLADEVDDWIGASDHVHFSDNNSIQAKDYFAQSAWKRISIRTQYINPRELYRPRFVQEVNILQRAVASSTFIDTVLDHCVNLKKISWKGSIIGALKQESRRHFRALESIEIYIEPTMRVSLMGDSAAFEHHNQNQICLLQRFLANKLKEINLHFTIMDDPQKNDSEYELTIELFKFLSLNNQCKSLEISISKRLLTSNQVQPQPPKLDIHIPATLTTEVFVLQLPNSNFNTQWNNLIGTSIKGLTSATISKRTHDWAVIEKLIANNSETLRTLDIRGTISEPISLNTLSSCKALTILKIHHRDSVQVINPIISNFGPHSNFLQNIKVLTFTNLQLTHQDVMSLKRFTQLKHLAIWGVGFEGGLNLTSLKVLLSIRTLDALLLHTGSFTAVNDEENSALQICLGNLVHFRTGNYINIQHRRVWWNVRLNQMFNEVDVEWFHY